MDIRLKKVDFELAGKKYKICCNMNVLADVQEAYGGDLTPALNGTVRAIMTFLAAMLNDYNDEHGGGETFSAKSLGRLIEPYRLTEVRKTVMELVTAALWVEKTSEDESSKNAGTTGEA